MFTPQDLDALFDASAQGRTLDLQKIIGAHAITSNFNPIHPFTKLSLIQTAAEKGHLSCIQALLDLGADLNFKNEYGHTALHLALLGRQTSLLPTLFQLGARLDAAPDIITMAAGQGDAGVASAQILIEKGASVNFIGSFSQSPLFIATERKSEKMVQLLLESGADVNALNWSRKTALHSSAAIGEPAILQLLIKHGAKLNARDIDQETPVHYAARHGNPQTLQLLIQSGAQINGKNQKGDTALHLAVARSRAECIEVLLECGAEIHLKNRAGKTAEDLSRQFKPMISMTRERRILKRVQATPTTPLKQKNRL